jgi:hypothetical protein
LFLDELAFVSKSIQTKFWSSVAPVLATGGACQITSTPNGDSDLFAELWRGALIDSNGYIPIHVKWDEPPGRDEEFKQKQIDTMGETQWRQEFECEFITSDAVLINPLSLVNKTKELEDVEPLRTVNGISFWENIHPRIPKPNNTYIVGVDPATGSGNDYTVIVVYSFPELEQVAEYRSNVTSTGDVYKILKNILLLLDRTQSTVYFTIENNGVGEGLLALYENDEDPPENAQLLSGTGKRAGMSTTKTTKLKACITMKEMIERRLLNFNSQIMLAELKSYIRRGGTYSAQIGSTDDVISATLLIVRILEILAPYEEEAFAKVYGGKTEVWDDWGDGEHSDDSVDDDGALPFII